MEPLFPYYVSEKINYVLDSVTLIDWCRKFTYQDKDIYNLTTLDLTFRRITEINQFSNLFRNLQKLELFGVEK